MSTKKSPSPPSATPSLHEIITVFEERGMLPDEVITLHTIGASGLADRYAQRDFGGLIVGFKLKEEDIAMAPLFDGVEQVYLVYHSRKELV